MQKFERNWWWQAIDHAKGVWGHAHYQTFRSNSEIISGTNLRCNNKSCLATLPFEDLCISSVSSSVHVRSYVWADVLRLIRSLSKGNSMEPMEPATDDS